jgi:S-adenosylmethionine:tRNA-ribosyltransferase-isomerase (queuine synthetase)
MNLSDFNYDLPEELIGQEAIEPRDSCKLMVLDKKLGIISHLYFDLNLLNDDFVLVPRHQSFSCSSVWPKESGGKIEVLLKQLLLAVSCICMARSMMAKTIFSKTYQPQFVSGKIILIKLSRSYCNRHLRQTTSTLHSLNRIRKNCASNIAFV